MYGLLNVAELSDDQDLRSCIHEEVQWGNKYCLKMQSSGRYIGSDTDGRTLRWTDNQRGTADDRPAYPGLAGRISVQHQFIAAEALLASVFGDRDRAYARECLDAAKRSFVKVKDGKPADYVGLGTGISAGLRLYEAILGTNPFGVSLVVHVGRVNPPEYVFRGFKPRVPFIPGAVMLGIGGDEADRPILKPGSFHTGEFSISRVYAFIWLLAEIQRSAQPKREKGSGVVFSSLEATFHPTSAASAISYEASPFCFFSGVVHR